MPADNKKQTKINSGELYSLPVDVVTPGTRCRCLFEVTAGLIPGQAMPEFTKRFALTSEQWEKEIEKARELGEAEGPIHSTFLEYQAAAFEYAAKLQNPNQVNWVRVDWIWF